MKSSPFTLQPIAALLVAAAWLALAGSAMATLVITPATQNGATPFTPTWRPATNSLIAGLAPTTALGNFSLEAIGRNVNSLTAGGSLTIATVANATSTNYVTCGTGSGSGYTIIYTLPAATMGYNLTNITVFGGWQDSGRDSQGYNVSYATAQNPNSFISLGIVNYAPPNAGNIPSATMVSLTDSLGGILAANVAVVKFDFTAPVEENGYEGYAAITVQGNTATNVTAPPLVITMSNQVNGANFTPTWPVETNSLIAGQLPGAVGLGNFTNDAGTTGLNALTDGTFGPAGTYSSYATCGGYQGGTSVTYALTNYINGFTLTNIVVYSGWATAGRDGQFYNVSYSTIAAPGTFIPLTGIFYNPVVSGVSANRVAISTSTGVPLASNVCYIKFDFTPQISSVENGYSGYAEIVLQGFRSPGMSYVPLPVLTQDTSPASAATYVGDQMIFTAAFDSSPPALLQWQYINGGVNQNIPGATNSTLVLTNVQTANSGYYQLEGINATNSRGVAFSTPVSLTVSSVPVAVSNLITVCSAQTGWGITGDTTSQYPGLVSALFYPTWIIATNSIIAGDTVEGGQVTVGPGNFALNQAGGNPDQLSDGVIGYFDYWPGVGSSLTEVTCGPISAGQSVTYTLPVVGGTGYDLTNIVVYGGWGDAGRDEQNYEVLYATVDSPTVFKHLVTVDYLPADPNAFQSATRTMIIPATSVLARNVAAVEFNFSPPGGTPENGYEGYSEIQIGGGLAAPVAPIITSQPQSATVYAGATVTLTATLAGSVPLACQWLYITNQTTNILTGATSASLVITNVTAASAGAYQLVVTNAVGSVRTSLATLSVITPAPGSYASAVLAAGPLVYWKLDETNNPAPGTAVAYDYAGGYNGVYQAGAHNGYNGVAGPQTPGVPGFTAPNPALATFANTANSYVTASAGSLVASNLTYAMWINPSGTVETYAGLLMDRGGAGEGLGFGGSVNASGMAALTYTWNQNTTSGFNSGLYPPANQWSFVAMVIAPNQTVLYLINTNGVQAVTNLLANDAEVFGVAWHLGDDGVFGGGVRTFPGSIDEVAVYTTALSPGQVLGLYYNGIGAPPLAAVPVATPATNLFVGNGVVLTEPATGATPLQYQWQFNGLALTGATNNILSLTNLTLASAGNYGVIISNLYGSVTSAPVLLSVTLDTNPPVVLRGFNIGTTNVELDFSKTVEAASATNPANYAFTNGLVITAVSLATNNSSVLLTTAPLTIGTNYGVVINGVRDRALPPNTIATNTLVTFLSSLLAPQDIGNPAIASTDVYTSAGVIITSAGSNIGGTSDQFNFDYAQQTGNFDVSVCLAGLGLSDLWAQAGLMARASLDPGSPFTATLATPGMNGEFFADRAITNGTAVTTGNFPVNYPHTWLRLNRVGNVFTGFGSYDGTNWTQLGSVTLALPSQIFLGLAVASHNAAQTTTARFVNYAAIPASAVVATMANPHDAMGPTSRMTPVVFSEIMWKPAPRTDGKDLEFVELYNSNPWFQDIGNYQITCADMSYTFPAGTTIPGGGYLVVAAAPADMTSVYGITNVIGPYTGSLKHAETLQLLDEQGSVLLTLPYTDVYPWPVATGGTGHSLVLANPTYGEGDPRAWDISDVVGGSPGQLDAFTPSPLRNVVINEIMPHSENLSVPQFIELYNHNSNSVDISGCILTDDPATNKFVIPAGTVIGPAGFAAFTKSQFGFTLNGAGETLYLIKPDHTRVLDAVQFGAQANQVSYGRWPDGANDFYAFTTNTPGTNNGTIVISDVVINELMYDPISGNDDDQYIELYNKGTNTINLKGWQFTSGVAFTFPSVTLVPNGYLVVAKNTTNLFAKYSNLNSGNTVGNYSGKLSHNGELVVLAMPSTLYVTNAILVAEDQVTYGTGGRWGEWSGGGGSSLELIDPRANHRLAANWADSDETQKSSWVTIQTTGVLDNGANYDPSIDYAQIGLLDAGECLVDNLQVIYNGSNYVSNGTFESNPGLTGWTTQGSMVASGLENSGDNSGHSLHIRCSDRLWTGDNSCEVALNPNAMTAGNTVTMSYQARWLRGTPEPNFRLNGNWLEANAVLPIPANLGTPGGPNSAYVTNAGPAIYNVTHAPSLPAANQPVVVTANLHDPDAVRNLTLYYRLDPALSYTAVPMNDGGTNGDAIAGDGVFSAVIPGQAANQVVAFYLAATDNPGITTRFPALRTNDNIPAPEGVVMFGDGNPGGSFGVYHVWITQTNLNRWANLGNISRDWNNDCTFVNGNRVIYNVGGRYTGSPAHEGYNTPNGNLCSFEYKFKDDDLFLGTKELKKLHQPGNTPGDDPSLQREQIANSLLRALGVPWLNRRYVAVYVNGSRRLTLMEDAQAPDSDVVKEHFPNDAGGYLYKMQPWFEMAPFLSGYTMGANNLSWCTLNNYTTTGGVKKPARYRYQYEIRRTADTCSDFTNVFSLIDAANAYGTPNYAANLENIANMENWMRVFAANHAGGNWDSFGAQNEQNLYGYIGTLGTKYTLLMWDFNISIGLIGEGYTSWAPGQNLFYVNPNDPCMSQIYNTPVFQRMYWRALQELVNGPLNVATSGPLITAKYNAFTANGLSVENPAASIEPWLSQAQSSIGSQLAAVNASSFTVNPTVVVSNNIAYVNGQAPVNVAAVWINGAAYPLTWNNLTNWTVSLPLASGTNNLHVVGVNLSGQVLAGASNSVSVVNNATKVSPVGQVVINEIMSAPAASNAQFVELSNNSTNAAFDLSGWQISGLGYTFPNGSVIGPTNRLVLAANNAAFAAAYGATKPVFDLFAGTLQPPQLLTLVQPNGNGTNSVAVTAVRYDTAAPWSSNAVVSGSSLQLIDSHQDNWRVGNWSVVPYAATPDAVNGTAQVLPAFPSLWINEVQPNNLTGITNRAGQHTPWLELYNPSTNVLSLSGDYLANNYTNLLQWAFPSNAIINAGQFLVVFADGLTNLSVTNQWHTSFNLPAGTGSLALSRLYSGHAQVLDYLDYNGIAPNAAYGSVPDGQSFLRQELFAATPGASNNASATAPPSFVDYAAVGSVYTQNFDALPNPGATSINSANPVTIAGITYSLANPFDFGFPAVTTGSSGGLGLSSLAGWYGNNVLASRFGATDGDQTTGGQLSFGAPSSSNRALGLLATSTTGGTAFGVRLINDTHTTLTRMNLQFTGEVWRQSNLPKTLQFFYFVDPTATASFPSGIIPAGATAYVPALNVIIPTVSADTGGVAVDGTQAVNSTNLTVLDQAIGNWSPGSALWLVWQMTDSTGKAQGLAIDNLSFSASVPIAVPLSAQTVGTNLFLSWPAEAGQIYQLEYKTNLTSPVWTAVGNPVTGTGLPLTLTNNFGGSPQRYFRLHLVN